MSIDPQKIKHLLICGLPLAIGAAVLAGAWTYRDGLAGQVVSLESNLASLSQQAAQLEKVSQVVTQLTSQSSAFAQRIPSNIDKGRLLEAISRELTARNVTEIETKGQPQATGVDFSRFTFGLTFQAPFETIYEIIEAIEAKQQIIRVDLMEIRGHVKGAKDRVAVHLKLSVFASTLGQEVAL